MSTKSKVKIAAIADIHVKKTSQGDFQALFKEIYQNADILALCGDLTDHGTAEEAHVLLKELAASNKIPIVAVLGNHDFESDNAEEVMAILEEGGVNVLDGEAIEIYDVGFAGAKGFGGGFGASMLGPWGEAAIKSFVHEAVNEALKLEHALTRLSVENRICLLHYSPIQATVEGERREIFAFLGSSRLEEPINRYSVEVVFHGHAHSGSPVGQTSTGIPVFNVAMPLLRARVPEFNKGYRLYEVDMKKSKENEERATQPEIAAPVAENAPANLPVALSESPSVVITSSPSVERLDELTHAEIVEAEAAASESVPERTKIAKMLGARDSTAYSESGLTEKDIVKKSEASDDEHAAA